MHVIGLRRDNIARMKQTAATGWPICWRCKQIVEGIGIQPDNERLHTYAVTAECRHGHPSTFFKDTKVMTLHRSWNENKRNQAIATSIFFFESAGEPMGNLVVARNRVPIAWNETVTGEKLHHPTEDGPGGVDRPRIILPSRW